MKIAYCGFDFFLGALNNLRSSGNEVIEVFSFPITHDLDSNGGLLEFAAASGARITLDPISLADLARLKDRGVRLLLTACYPHKVPDWRGYVDFGLNVHPSPLPDGRGPLPLPWTIIKELPSSALTFHELSAKFDCGDIVAQYPICVREMESLETLSLRIQMLGSYVIPRVVADLDNLWPSRVKQEGGSFWKLPRKVDCSIKWSEHTSSDILRISRAYGRFGVYSAVEGREVVVTRLDAWSEHHSFAPGVVVHRSHRDLVLATLDGFASFLEFSYK